MLLFTFMALPHKSHGLNFLSVFRWVALKESMYNTFAQEHIFIFVQIANT